MFEEIDSYNETTTPVAPLPSLEALEIFNGLYVLSFPFGDERRFRVRTEKNGPFAGRRTLAMLIGPDGTDEFETCAFLGEGGFAVWKRFKNQKQAEYAAILWSLARSEELDGYSLTITRKCFVCNRPLSEAYYDRGYGKTCAKKFEAATRGAKG